MCVRTQFKNSFFEQSISFELCRAAAKNKIKSKHRRIRLELASKLASNPLRFRLEAVRMAVAQRMQP